MSNGLIKRSYNYADFYLSNIALKTDILLDLLSNLLSNGVF